MSILLSVFGTGAFCAAMLACGYNQWRLAKIRESKENRIYRMVIEERRHRDI
jgi:hypothetical protein